MCVKHCNSIKGHRAFSLRSKGRTTEAQPQVLLQCGGEKQKEGRESGVRVAVGRPGSAWDAVEGFALKDVRVPTVWVHR